jgi:hypothetical protein
MTFFLSISPPYEVTGQPNEYQINHHCESQNAGEEQKYKSWNRPVALIPFKTDCSETTGKMKRNEKKQTFINPDNGVLTGTRGAIDGARNRRATSEPRVCVVRCVPNVCRVTESDHRHTDDCRECVDRRADRAT